MSSDQRRARLPSEAGLSGLVADYNDDGDPAATLALQTVPQPPVESAAEDAAMAHAAQLGEPLTADAPADCTMSAGRGATPPPARQRPRLDNLPPEVPDEPPRTVLDKMRQYYVATQQGHNFTANLRRHKEFNNPYILDKVIATFEIDQYGSNYPPELFDPRAYAPSDYFEAVSAAQQAAEDARAAVSSGRSAVAFTSTGPQNVSLFPAGTVPGLVPAAQASGSLAAAPGISGSGAGGGAALPSHSGAGAGTSAAPLPGSMTAVIMEARAKAAAVAALGFAGMQTAAAGGLPQQPAAANTARRSKWDA